MTDTPRRSGRRHGRPARNVWVTLAAVGIVVAILVLRGRHDSPQSQTGSGEVSRLDEELRESPTPVDAGVRETDERTSGELTEIADDVFESTAGLIYGPGSREGHRIDHILRHAADDPDRPVHGVFDGNRAEIFAVLDEAYTIAKQRGPPVDVEEDGERTVYTIDMGRRIGFVGGESGRRDGHPDAKHIRLVLEDRNVITAFPLNP